MTATLPPDLEVICVEIAKLDLGPDDILIVRVPSDWGSAQIKSIFRETARLLITSRVIVMNADVDIAVVHPDSLAGGES